MQRVRAAVHADQDGLELAHVRADDPQVALVARARARRRAPAGRGTASPGAGTRCPRRAGAPRRGGSASCCRRTPRAPPSRGRAAPPAPARARRLRARARRRAASRSRRASSRGRSASPRRGRWSKRSAPGASIKRTPPRTSVERPRVRKAAGLGRRHVDHDAHARLESSSAETRSRSVWSMIAMSSGPAGGRGASCAGRAARSRELDEAVHRRVERNSWPPSIRSSSTRRSLGAQMVDGRVRRVARHLLHAEMAVREARDLREVSDGDHLRALGQPLQRAADGMRGLAADACVDLVEDHRVAASDGGDRERDSRQLAAGRRLGCRAERKAAVRTDRGTRRGRRRSRRDRTRASSARNSPSPRPIPCSSAATAVRERPRRCLARRAKLCGDVVHPLLRAGELPGRRGCGIDALLKRVELATAPPARAPAAPA